MLVGAFHDGMFHVMQFGEIYAGLIKDSRHDVCVQFYVEAAQRSIKKKDILQKAGVLN